MIFKCPRWAAFETSMWTRVFGKQCQRCSTVASWTIWCCCCVFLTLQANERRTESHWRTFNSYVRLCLIDALITCSNRSTKQCSRSTRWTSESHTQRQQTMNRLSRQLHRPNPAPCQWICILFPCQSINTIFILLDKWSTKADEAPKWNCKFDFSKDATFPTNDCRQKR